MSLGGRLLLFGLFCGTGLFIVLQYFGVIPASPGRRCRAIFCEPDHWQVLCFGLSFLCAGLAILTPPRYPRLGKAFGMALIGNLLAGLIGSFLFR
jgi:hypothetical protein